MEDYRNMEAEREVKEILAEEQEAEQAKEQADMTLPAVSDSGTGGGFYTHVLARPFKYGNVTFTKFEFDFEKLSGADMVTIENEMGALGEFVVSPEISTSFLARMAARAAGVGSDVILGLSLRDFGKIRNEARNFLTNTGY